MDYQREKVDFKKLKTEYEKSDFNINPKSDFE